MADAGNTPQLIPAEFFLPCPVLRRLQPVAACLTLWDGRPCASWARCVRRAAERSGGPDRFAGGVAPTPLRGVDR